MRFLTEPVVHSVDPVDAPPVEMDHHVFHVSAEQRLAVLVELASRSPRTVMFTRTKYRAKTLARQLNANGVTAVEMHGNLAQNARERNLAAFSDGSATTLVATDIAARGIHVDDVALVVHADPPIEHKAYLHRSGRTARAGNAGTVITVTTADQVARRERPDAQGRHPPDDHHGAPQPPADHPARRRLRSETRLFRSPRRGDRRGLAVTGTARAGAPAQIERPASFQYSSLSRRL